MKFRWLAMAVLAVQGFASVETIGALKEARVESAKPGTLVIFDVDEVLISPKDALLHPASGHFEGWKKVPLTEFENFLSIMFANGEYGLIDPRAGEWIQGFKERGVQAMALTACWTGKLGVIESMVDWRIAQLEELGIDFAPFFAEEFVFNELVEEKASPPLFRKGILFCGDFYSRDKSTKGKLLGAFLDRLDLKPEGVIFIDDDLNNVEAVDQELAERGIPCAGYHLKREAPALDEKVALYQLEKLVDERQWLSETEAKRLLETKG